MRRELWETLVELMESVNAIEHDHPELRVTNAVINIPIEVRAEMTQVGFRLLADLPRWEIKTGFEERPSRLKINLYLGDQT
ncbi:MAG: hypothetical protein AAF821_08250 [Cyanobacteria bacterium P01_D01_bin.156]